MLNPQEIYRPCKLMFIALCAVDNVGAATHELLCDCHRQSTYFNSLRSATRPAVQCCEFAKNQCEYVKFYRTGG
ncbi:MAG: hypothetical protein IKT52_14625 [Oscillospiraceae bacterium]|nr:hypothetical protein [Oscillospiraceae bacterium]